MKKITSYVKVCMQLLFVSFALQLVAQPAPPSGKRWVPVQELTDEFNQTSGIDASKWDDYHPHWSGRPPSAFKRGNAFVEGGYLKLRSGVRRHPSTVNNPLRDVWVDAAACVSKQKSARPGYYYEARFKASSLSMTSSFWFRVGQYSEIDVIEHIGNPSRQDRQDDLPYEFAANTHYYGPQSGPPPKKATWVMPTRGRDEFHTYGFWWKSPNELIFYHNDVQVMTIVPRVPLAENLKMIFDTEVFPFAQAGVPSIGLPKVENLNNNNKNTMLVDWVHVYKLENGTAPPVAQAPFGGSARNIPGVIESEDFDVGGQGVAYNDANAANNGGQYRTGEGVDIEVSGEGGHNIGWISNNEWLEYTVNVSNAGDHDVAIRYAALSATGQLRIEFNGVDKTNTVNLPPTGAWQTYQTVTKTVNLSAGQQIMRVFVESGSFNLNKLTFSAQSNISVTGVNVSPATLSLSTGQTSALTATVSPSNASNKSVTWSSNNTAVATVNASGVATAVTTGSATITATTVDGGFSDNTIVTVTASAQDQVSLAGAPTTIASSSSIVIPVSYTATTQREIVASFWKAGVWQGNALVTVSAGSGTANATVTLSTAPVPDNDYSYKVHIRPLGTGWQDATDNDELNNITVQGQSQSQTVTLLPTSDSYLQGSTNFNANIIRLENGSRVGYLKFDLSGINGTITDADLKFTVNGDAGNGNLNINLGSSNNWTEANLSNANKPSAGTLLGSINETYSIGNVKSVPLQASSISGNEVSLVLTATSGNDFAVASKENTGATGPQLVVTYQSGGARVAATSEAISGASLYPNPVSGELFTIDLNGYDGMTAINILDQQGRSVLVTETMAASVDVHTSVFPSGGLYFIKIQGGDNMSLLRVIIQ